MKLDRSYSNLTWRAAIKRILENTANEINPILIVRHDNPTQLQRMRNYFTRRKNCVFVKLGIAYCMSRLYEDLLFKLSGVETTSFSLSYHEGAIQSIRLKIKATKGQYVFVIDNCQHFVFSQIFSLLGLVIALEGRVQFIFIVAEEYIPQWRRNARVRASGAEYFLEFIKHRYDLT